MNKNEPTIAKKISELFAVSKELEALYPGRSFSIDGHLLGSIGEVLVADKFNLKLLNNSEKTHDAVDSEGGYYQIKATQINKISISSEPDNIIIVKIEPNGSWEVMYKGPGKLIWDNSSKMQKNGQRQFYLSKIKKLMGW